MYKREDAIKYVRSFLQACIALPVTIDRAILFGSVLSGKATDDSDIDLALFSGNFTEDILRNLDHVAKVNILFPDIDIHTFPANAYAGHGLLLDEIKRTGIEIEL